MKGDLSLTPLEAFLSLSKIVYLAVGIAGHADAKIFEQWAGTGTIENDWRFDGGLLAYSPIRRCFIGTSYEKQMKMLSIFEPVIIKESC